MVSRCPCMPAAPVCGIGCRAVVDCRHATMWQDMPALMTDGSTRLKIQSAAAAKEGRGDMRQDMPALMTDGSTRLKIHSAAAAKEGRDARR